MPASANSSGPLKGVRVIEFAGIGPGPFCAMLLSDMGAEVIRIDRRTGRDPRIAQRGLYDITQRGRRSLVLDLKHSQAANVALRLVEKADAVMEGFRPGVMERLGLGPDVCLQRNPRLVYGRMTGWGQTGPLAQAAGHDINYIALSGVLHAIGRKNSGPVPPLNLAGDFGGGALYLAMGMCAALFEAARSGKGQVIDCAMTEGSASLMASFYGLAAAGLWEEKRRGENILDTGAHFYDAYETADGEWIAIGSIEPKFYALLREKLGLNDPIFDEQMNRDKWPEMKKQIATVIKTKTRAEWREIMEGSDVCFAPVLSMSEAAVHPHNKARQSMVDVGGIMQPNAAPRFSRTPSKIQGPPSAPGADSESVLADFGFSTKEIKALAEAEAV